MSETLGLRRRVLKPFLDRAVDLFFPPHSLDPSPPEAAAPQSQGLSAHSWSRIRFLENPVCDGCGQPQL